MPGKRTIAVLAVSLLVVGAGAAALATGFGPAPGGESGGDDIEHFPTETSADDSTSGSGDDSNSGSDSTDDSSDDTQQVASSPFTFVIDQIEDCGTTCRDVTVTLTNEQNQTDEDVTVYTRIYAGNTTDDDARIWEGKEAVGTMDAGASVTRTQRVSLSYSDAYSVQQNDGWITVVTTVQSNNETLTFTEHRDVA